MFRQLSRRIQDVRDTIRFMPKATRRRIYLGVSIGCTMVTTGTYFCLQTFKLNWFVEQLQMYRMKMPMPLNEDLYYILGQCTEEHFHMKDFPNPLYLFNFFGSDVYSVGCLTLPTGAFIGLPFNFNLNSIQQLDVQDIRLLGKYRTKRTRESPVIKKLFQSLILSDDAKKYIMVHELYLLTSSYFYVKCLNIMATTWFYTWLVPRFNKTLGLYNQKKFRTIVPRLMGGFLCLCFCLFIGIAIDQSLDYIYDLRALKQAITNFKNMDNDNEKQNKFYNGAMEYYQKLIERNQAMYELLADQGNSFFTPDGRTKKLFGLCSISHETHLAILESRMNINKN